MFAVALRRLTSVVLAHSPCATRRTKHSVAGDPCIQHGNPYDNATAESFMETLKVEEVSVLNQSYVTTLVKMTSSAHNSMW